MGTEGEGGFLTVRIKYKEAEQGVLVGQCREFPFIIVKGKTLDDLAEQVRMHINVYFKTFPEEGMKIIQTHGKAPEEKTEELEAGWKQEEKAITVSVKT
jgi:predicted RNase H-like HicB family nuclease